MESSILKVSGPFPSLYMGINDKIRSEVANDKSKLAQNSLSTIRKKK